AFPHRGANIRLRKPGFPTQRALSWHHSVLPLEDAMLAQAIRDEIRPDYTMDQPVERYTAGDHAVWRRLFERQAETLQGRACDQFLDGLSVLGVAKERIPSFERLSEALTKATGWKIVAVPGLVPDEVFFAHL